LLKLNNRLHRRRRLNGHHLRPLQQLPDIQPLKVLLQVEGCL
jgi:hypothetical protein